MIIEWYFSIKSKLVSICVCGLSKNSIPFAAKIDYLQSIRGVTDAWSYGELFNNFCPSLHM